MSRKNSEAKTQVYYDAPPARPAPVSQTGAWAWIRNNLLSSPVDIVLTILAVLTVVYVLVTFWQWGTQSANWWAVRFNIRQFMVGGYDADLEWRVGLSALISAFVMGMGLAVWIKPLARLSAILLVGVAVFVLSFPPIVINSIAPSPVYLLAGGSFTVGNYTDTIRPSVAFVGRADEVVTVRYTNVQDDTQLAQLSGFVDRQLSSLRAFSVDRFALATQKQELEATLERDKTASIPLLTPAQRARIEQQLSRLTVLDPITQTLGLNQAGVTVTILNGETLEPIDSRLLEKAGDSLRVILPSDGWYILEKTMLEGSESSALLAVEGVSPILRSSVAQPGGGFVTSYLRMIDEYRTITPLPKVNGQDAYFMIVNDHQYRGDRPLEAFLRLYLAPSIQPHANNIALLVVMGFLGYWAVLFLERVAGKGRAQTWTTWAFVALPVVIWVAAAGVEVPEILNLSMVLGAIAFMWWAGQVGALFGRSLSGILLFLLGLGVVMGVPYLAFAPHYGFGMLPIVNLLAFFPALVTFWTGTDGYGIGDTPALKRAVLWGGMVTFALLVVPLAFALSILPPSGNYGEWFLRHSDQRNWGGLLLTMILTIFGIVASFPLGVLLALGRRSSLPAIKYGSTLYIELVRGSPFVTVLFFGQLLIPLISPSFAEVPGTVRALVATILFSAAYLAENVRGGLQSLPPGQTEAGKALGLSAWQVTYLVTLPQALRAVIPALVGQFISLFKDTSLVAIVGLIDLTGFVNSMVVQAEFTGTRREGLFFISLIYFVFSYVMSYVSRLLERSGSGAARRI